ncbi:pyrroloquinoline quinone biosynthesis protein PqqE [Coralloluteibacterium stylophorae]|uniref:PqqA peptide cyclase n=1 Tax=Coralloluteibacterium stylophorae TaxID=1776034 RepID=A0A8J7VVE6_9GAMM|nr:pyrroloquinoline quinone biosynthesis protein PqqE [Coralloluteibacterium stylophorae]MBS7456609.1 pyrroloquinoline quinone biosynthesis protein PqqE [Coralloluteibacterium stylophorae]
MNAQRAPAPHPETGPPFWLLAELTYQCPLHCAFCYNPVDFARVEDELSTEDWLRVLRQGRELGAVQCGFSGGEPLQRRDLETLVAEAHRLGYYTNLITSGIGLNERRIADLKAAGLDHIQLSFQDSTREVNDFLSSTRTFDLKRKAAALIKQHGYEMVLNCVIHRLNIDHVEAIIEMAVAMEADYLELANTQYYAWAHVNREHLLPTREQLARAEAVTVRWRERLEGRTRLIFVVPDYYETRPKKCMNGWGNVFLTIAPDGAALPCHTARMLPGLAFPNVRDLDLRAIWYDSEGFNRFRGTDWMQEPCRSCPEKEKDLGGCRCQAWMLAQDPAAADPVCAKSPRHGELRAVVERAQAPQAGVPAQPLVFRGRRESKALGRPF